MEQDTIKSEISAAFGEDEFPSDMMLLYDENCTHEECIYLNRVFSGRRWKDIAQTAKPYRDDIFSFFSLGAFHYYVPAFMFIVIDQYEEADVMVDAFLHALQRNSETGMLDIEELAQDRIPFTKQQRIAIARFFLYVCTKHDNPEACTVLKSRK